MNYNGIQLERADFGNDLRDKIAFDVAFYGGVTCSTKKAALEMLYHAADQIIEQIKPSD